MNCRKCKREIPDISVYCLYCGAKQHLDSPARPKARGNGQGSVFRLPNGKYRAEVVLGYYTVDGKMKKKSISRSFVRKVDAVAALPELRKTAFAPKLTDISLFSLHELYTNSMDYNALSQSQRNKLDYAWKRLAPIEMRMISTLTVWDLQYTIDSAVKTFYPARDMKVMLSHLYNIAIRKEIISHNKAEYIELPESPTAKKERWSDTDLQAFWTDYEQHSFTGYILIMIYAGLRYGELATIQLADIDLERKVMVGGIKTEAGTNREIPIADKILPIVRRAYEKAKYKLLEMNEDNFYNAYWTTIARLELRHLPPQTCRHTYFSLMTAAGIQAGIITETGGHASYLTTMKNYVSLSLEEKLEAVNKI